MKINRQDAINAFSRTATDANIASKHIRSKMDYADQQVVLNNVNGSNPHVRDYLTGICFASSWKEIWNRPKTSTISSSRRATDWFVLTTRMFPSELKSHVTIRNSLNSAILRGEWQVAATLLHQHIKDFGPTFWSLNWSILLFEESYGFQKKLEYVKSFEEPECGDITYIFANYYCFSSDQTLAEETFRKIITNGLPEKSGIRHFLELMFLEDCTTNWSLPEILDYFEFVPLIDRYELFIRLALIALGENHPDSHRLVNALADIDYICPDPCTQYIVDTFLSKKPVLPVSGTTELLKAWDAFATSNYALSLKISTEIVVQFPYLLPAHEIAVKSKLYLKNRDTIIANTPVSALAQHLENIFAKNEKSDDSLKFLKVFGRRFRIISLTHPLRALCANLSSDVPDENQFRRGSYSYAVHGPRNFEYGHDLSTNFNYLQRCAATYPNSVVMRFFCSLASGELNPDSPAFEQMPKVRRIFFAGLSAARQNKQEQALAFLKGFLRLQKDDAQNPLSPFAIEEARRSLVDIYRLKGDVVNMQAEVINTLLDRPQAVRRLPVGRIFEASKAQRQIACAHIEYPIIAHLACDDPHDIYIALKHYLSNNGASKPSDLTKLIGLSTKRLSHLLLKVCTTEVIDSLDALDSVAKVEAERLSVLRWVSKNGSSSSPLAETEILRLVQHIQLRDALEKIDGSRIVVNVAALREAERDRFKDIFLRFVALREVAASKATEHINELINTIKSMEIPDGKVLLIDSQTLRPQRESTVKAFAAAFLEIRNAFVYSAHFGVEASLSGRIRHGIVIQHIRKPFVEKHLAVLKDSTERVDIEKYWQSRLNCSAKSVVDQAMSVLFHLTTAINSIAEEVKNIWLHSRIEDKHLNGLFNFAFYTAELERILDDKMHDARDTEAFLDRIFDVLLERTRSSLVNTRNRIDTELRERLGAAVNAALSSLADSSNSAHFLALRNDLSICRQEVERLCDQMILWFQEADATLMGDAGLDLVLRTAIGMIEQLNPETRERFSCTTNATHRIKGRYFTSLVHIVFFMLDNAHGHSDLPKSDFLADVNSSVINNRLTIAVKSKMASQESLLRSKTHLLAKVRQLEMELDPETVTKEGGSGFAKIFAEIRYGFKQQNPRVTAAYDETNYFTVTVEFSLEGLSA